jgi:hypothetical protein
MGGPASNRCLTPEELFLNRKGAKSAEKDMQLGKISLQNFSLCALCAFAVQ